jgi:hypothetical protein
VSWPAFNISELNNLLYDPLHEMARTLGLIISSEKGDHRQADFLYRSAKVDETQFQVRLAMHSDPCAVISLDSDFFEDLTPEGWTSRFARLHQIMENAAEKMRGQLIVEMLNTEWSMNYTNDDELQQLERAALKIMTFVDARRQKAVV